jgi:KaiC/GvpD/RAD55 family RecA-like ATPase
MGYGGLAVFYYEKGEYARAKELAEKGYELMKKTGAKMMQWWYSYYITDVSIDLGETERALSQIDNLYRSAQEVEAKTGDKLPLANAERLKAKLLRTQGKWEESIEYFNKSLQDAEALNAKRWWIYSYAKYFLFDFALVYLERGQEGDREKARSLLNEALEIFQKIGAKKEIERTEAKIIYIETAVEAVSQVKPTVEISKARVATGYAGLDELLYGGVPSNYAIVLTSPSCDERDSLIEAFLEIGVDQGEVTFYVTIDPRAAIALVEKAQPNFNLFVCNPQADAVVKDSANVFKLKGVENLTEINIALSSAIRRLDSSVKGPRRICLDLVSDILLQHHAVQTRRWLTSLIAELKSAGFTILAVLDPRMHSSEELYAILGLFEGEINLYEKETEKGSQKYLKIKKMRNQKYAENELPLKNGDLQ